MNVKLIKTLLVAIIVILLLLLITLALSPAEAGGNRASPQHCTVIGKYILYPTVPGGDLRWYIHASCDDAPLIEFLTEVDEADYDLADEGDRFLYWSDTGDIVWLPVPGLSLSAGR